MTQDWKALKREARSRKTSAARLIELAALDPKLSREIARSRNAPLPLLDHLSCSSDMQTRRAVAAHPATSSALLERLATDRQWTVLKEVASNGATPLPVLAQLANHKRNTVRAATLIYPHRPPDLLDTLSRDPDPVVRAAAALDRALDPVTLQRLLHDPDGSVRANAMQNRATTTADRLRGLIDTDGQVRAHALGLLPWQAVATLSEERCVALIRDPDVRVRRVAVDHLESCTLPDGVIEQLATERLSDEDDTVRAQAARWAAPAALAGHVADPCEKVRCRVAERCDDLNALHHLAHDLSPHVRVALAHNLATPTHLLMAVMASLDQPSWIYPAFLSHPNFSLECWTWVIDNHALMTAFGWNFLFQDMIPQSLRGHAMRNLVQWGADLALFEVAVQVDLPDALIPHLDAVFDDPYHVSLAEARLGNGASLSTFALRKLIQLNSPTSDLARSVLSARGENP